VNGPVPPETLRLIDPSFELLHVILLITAESAGELFTAIPLAPTVIGVAPPPLIGILPLKYQQN